MKCPSCQAGKLKDRVLEGLFPCKNCDNCHGNWILMEDYIQWHTKNPDKVIQYEEREIPASETKRALICPINGNLMLKYRISKDSENRLDYSLSTKSVWLDEGEWQLLVKLELVHQLKSILTPSWQKKIRDDTSIELSEKRNLDRFGIKDYVRLKKVRDWLDNHPQKRELIHYLTSDD